VKIPRLYLDTSVIGGYFDPEFAEATRRLFDGCRDGRGVILVSSIVVEELVEAPLDVRGLVIGPGRYSLEEVDESPESVELAEAYLAAAVVSAGFYDDCRHVALATVTRADLLVSWNFRHIVQFDRIRKFNSVNLARGYGLLDIRSPQEVFQNED
jgi:predicted nucleic acid-binding protein